MHEWAAAPPVNRRMEYWHPTAKSRTRLRPNGRPQGHHPSPLQKENPLPTITSASKGAASDETAAGIGRPHRYQTRAGQQSAITP